MSTPNQPRTGLRPQHEFVPQEHYYPAETVCLTNTALEAARDEAYTNPSVAAEIEAYHGYPGVQWSVLDEEANKILGAKAEQQTKQQSHYTVTTRNIASSEPLVFYWHRTGQLENKFDLVATNPGQHISAMLTHIATLTTKQLTEFAATITEIAALGDDDQSYELKSALANRAKELGQSVLTASIFNTVVSLDQKRVA